MSGAHKASRRIRLTQPFEMLLAIIDREMQDLPAERPRPADPRLGTLFDMSLVTDLPSSGRIAYVGPDNRQTGRVAGELMGRFLGPSGGEVLIVLGMHRMIGHGEREMGFRSVLRERFPACTIAASLESGEDQARAGEVVHRALRNNPGVRGVYNVSAGNLAIAKAIRSLGLERKIVLITHEITSERRQMLREGILDAVIDQNPRLEAVQEVIAARRRAATSRDSTGRSRL